MAPTVSRAAPVGSAHWIQSEKQQAAQFVDQEVEEFGFSVRNELEWLDEHIAEIFSTNHVNFTEVFKTPGKLRGKTPRTARKRDALAPRPPLTDMFAPNTQPASKSPGKSAFYEKVLQFQVAEDAGIQPSQSLPPRRSKSPQRAGKPGNTDSGYHGITEDEMDVDARTETATCSSEQSQTQKVPLRENQPPPQRGREGTAEDGPTSDESFTSAKEDFASRNASREQLRGEEESDNATVVDGEMDVDQNKTKEIQSGPQAEDEGEEPIDEDIDGDTSRSPTDVSSPERLMQRKSSFTFASLPAREPFTAKRSIDARNSQIDAQMVRNSVLERPMGGKSVGPAKDEDEEYAPQKPEEAKAHSKSSTQLLHERITLLGKNQEPRASKSVAHSALQAAYPRLPSIGLESATPPAPEGLPTRESDRGGSAADEDDDWIAPSKHTEADSQKLADETAPKESTARPAMHQKSISTTLIPSPSRDMAPDARHQKAVSVSNVSLAHATGDVQSATPAGSPNSKRFHEGPISASKNRLWSALKTAKNIFASSASASAAAKLEAHTTSPTPKLSPKRDFSDESGTAAVFTMPGALYSESQLPPTQARPVSVVSLSPSRKTRSSSESEKKRQKELKAQQKAAVDLEKAREKERHKAAKQQDQRLKVEQGQSASREKEREQAATQLDRQVSSESGHGKESEMAPPPVPKGILPAGKLRAPGRLMKPAKEQPQAGKPAPVSIRVASQSQRLHQAPPPQVSLSKSQHEAVAPPPPPKSGLRTTSAQGSIRSSTAPHNARVKALEAAARKKEADEKAAQKKAEQKRELERKRAAKAEEERRADEERKAAEHARVQEAKMAAQRKAEQQAAEARKREQQRLEEQRQQEEVRKAKAAHELAEAIKRERAAQQPPPPRGDVGGTLRQLAAKHTLQEQPARPPVQPNPAKPAKRMFQPDEDDSQQPPQRPGLQRGPPSYLQNEAKRRRTDEELDPDAARHSVMAPPKRPSNKRKESTLSKFPLGYTHAPPPATLHTANMFKATVTAQHQLQHAAKPVPSHPSQTVQTSTARIPFAANANPIVAQHPGQMHPGFENALPSAAPKYKTPVRPAQAPKSAKSSPMYPRGDNIELPDIATDSEDEDSEDEQTGGFRAPSWVASPALRDLLTQQQLVDPETVFGPIGELKMDEVFKNGKNPDRLKRFRDRGSSAAWIESGDAVTSAEKRKDMELRERVVRDGGWRYEPGA